MNNKVLTVVIPSYNVEKYLNETIPYFLDKRILSDIEILIVNDGSKDRTSEIGKEWQLKYPQTIRLINKENAGHGSTINKGIEEAKGEYFKVVDGDDWVETEEFVNLICRLKEESADVILTPFKRVIYDAGEEQLVDINGLDAFVEYDFKKVAVKLVESYQMHCITIKTELLRKMPKISEHCFYVDQEYNIYPIQYINTIKYYPFNVYRYRIGTTEQSMNIFNMIKNRKMHEKVTFNLLALYLTLDNDFKKNFVEKRVEMMCERQIRILLSMEITEGTKNELYNFLRKVKEKSEVIYNNIPGKKALILRKMGINSYKLVAIIQHGRNKK